MPAKKKPRIGGAFCLQGFGPEVVLVGVGHGDRSLVDAMAEQSARTSYIHATAFTTDALESYADAVAPLLPMDDPRIYPVSGGSEAVETAIKLARAFHLARGEASRTLVIGRRSSYHGNTLAALDAATLSSLLHELEKLPQPKGSVWSDLRMPRH